jgi:hypothetical protein
VGLSLIISFAERTTVDVELLFICDTRAALKSSDIGPKIVHSSWSGSLLLSITLCKIY